MERDFPLGDETRKIFLSTKGENDDEVPKELIHFLGYMVNSTDEYVSQVKDDNISLLHDKVTKLKKRRELEAQYMTFEELVRSRESKASAAGKAEGKAEDILELLEDCGTISEELKTRVMEERDAEVLKGWLKLAAKSGSIEEFTSQM